MLRLEVVHRLNIEQWHKEFVKFYGIKIILQELQLPITLSMKLYCNNKTAIILFQNPIQHDQTKHVEIDRN